MAASILSFTCPACGRMFQRQINEVRFMTKEHVDIMPSQFCSYSCELHGWDPEAVRVAKMRRELWESDAEEA